MNRKYTRLLLLLAFCQTSLLNAQGWERLYPLGLGLIDQYRIAPMGDGGFLMSASTNNPATGTHVLIRLSPSGAVEWVQNQQSVLGITEIVAILPSDQGELLFLGRSGAGSRLVKTDANLNQLWTIAVSATNVFLCSTAGGYVLAYPTSGSFYSPVVMIKTNLNGDVVWQNTFTLGDQQTLTGISYLKDIISDEQGNIYLSGVEEPHHPNLVKFTPSGVLVYQKSYPSPLIYGFLSLAVVNDNRIVGTTFYNTAVMDSMGNVVSILPQPYGEIIATSDGNLLAGYIRTGDLHLHKFDLDNTEYWKHTTDLIWNLELFQMLELPDGGTIGVARAFTGSSYDPIVVRTDANGLSFTNRLSGNVLAAPDGNCPPTLPDALPARGRIVQLEKQGDLRYTTTDTAGYYRFDLDTGTYLLRVLPPNGLWQACADEVPVTFTAFFDSVQQDLGLAAQTACPWPEVQLGAPFLRRCFPSTYTVQYANNGSIAAEDAVVRLILDPYLSLQTASLPYTEVAPQIFEFPVGDLPPFATGSFTVTVLVDCDNTTLGQIHCSTAEILIGNSCPTTPLAVPVLQLTATCDGDSAQFLIRNIGDAPMTVPAEFIVIEDLIVMRQGTFQLNAQQELPVRCPSNGATMRLYAGQMPGGVPFFSPTAAIEGCNGPVHPGFWNMFPEFVGSTAARDCQPNIGSYDPNDKLAVPTGYDTERYIGQNVPIAYTIRFQNTGTDTAFTVVIRDTLSPWLDAATVRPGPASHAYTWKLLGKNALEFRFDNILLPDSTTNLDASQGYVKFDIAQMPDVPLGTDIFNDAAIYFDYNTPIITNTVRHLVGKDFIYVGLWSPVRPLATLRVWPNPVSDRVSVSVLDVSPGAVLDWSLYDAAGRLALQQTTTGGHWAWQRGTLPAGTYWLRVEEAGALLGVGKVVVR